MHNHKRTILSWKSQKVGMMRGSSWQLYSDYSPREDSTSQPHGSKLDNHSSSTLQRSVKESCCLWSCTLHGRHHFRNNLKEIAQEQCVCRACELSIKRSMKKNVNGEIYNLRKTFAVFHLVPSCSSVYWKRD